ncbi:uncharacterized protein LOC119831575 [Zerene cesonia]|uniref:uncharacterized protein LOC119831575 n=1 Tax=Zerene cesonia TaxID=33412 RepID=UPI0018E4EF0F|nr:uncharacterized protein LOC119831575 [Zerene cesonia]
MKSLRKPHSTSQTCSCTSCLFNSDTDGHSFQKFLVSGSKIDRLYYGKYIPLRERKLLDKLVRTRAVYDDIRAQLVSDSTSSLQKNANFKRYSSASELDDTEKSSAILELVNLVDKGAAIKSSKLSECCSCCSCSLKMRKGEHAKNLHKHKHVHGHKYVGEKQRYEFKRRKGVRFKAKHIKSDPCTCTFQFSSRAKIQSKQQYEDSNDGAEAKAKSNKFKAVAKKSLQKLVDSKTNLQNKMDAAMAKIQDSKIKLEESLALHTNESLEKIERMKYRIRRKQKYPESMAFDANLVNEGKSKTSRLKNLAKSSRDKLKISQARLKNKMQEGGEIVEMQVKKSLEKIKKTKDKIKSIICECPEYISEKEKDLSFKAKKEAGEKVELQLKQSLEKMKKSKDKIKSIICECPEYISEKEYDLFFKAKKEAGEKVELQLKQSLEKMKQTKDKIKSIICECPEYVSEKEKELSFKIKKEVGKNLDLQFKKSLEKIKKSKDKIKSIICECPEYTSEKEKELALKIRKDSIRKFKENLNKKQYLENWTCENDCTQGACIAEECYEKLKRRKGHTKKIHDKHYRHSSIRKMSSREVTVSILPKKSNSGIQAQQIIVHKGTNHAKKGVNINKSSKKNKEKGQEYLKNKRKKNERPALSSFSSEQNKESHPAVRIGSSASFNVEFYKDKSNPTKIKSSYPSQRTDIEQSSTTQRSRPGNKQIVSKHKKGSHVKLKVSKRDIKQKGYALKRCFCTLKLKPKRPKSVSQKSTGTITTFKSQYRMETGNLNRNKINIKLQPYECEPGICVPYKCNPYHCIKLQNKRLITKKRIRSKNSYTTSSRKTRSTSSVTPKEKSSKAKHVQSAAIIPIQMHIPKKEKGNLQNRNEIAEPNRNVVRIGSTFSFNIDFYRDTGKQQSLSKQTNMKSPDLQNLTLQPKMNKKVHLQKPKRNKEKKYKKQPVVSTTGTETSGNFYKKTRSKATKTGSNLSYYFHLDPYECEPFTCIPGECDPYICLQNIKKRLKKTKEISLGTINPGSISTSSYTYSYGKSKDVFVQSKPNTKEQKVSVQTKAQPVSKVVYTPKISNMQNKLRNSISVGSTFSFNIEFSKTCNAKEEQFDPPPIPLDERTKRKVKHKGIKLDKITVDNIDTQVEKTKKVDKSSVVGPILKRCFCTLNLYKKRNRHKDKHNIPKNTMYTVNTALISSDMASQLHLCGMSEGCISEKRSKYEISRNNSIFHLDKGRNTNNIAGKQSLEINSDLSVSVELIKKSSHRQFFFKQTKLQEANVVANYDRFAKFQDDFINPVSINPTKTSLAHYLNSCIYAMNMQVDNKNIMNRKLKPYECEPGICIPGQCDPYECQKLIMKRLQKRISKSSGTPTDSRSISSSQTRKTPTQSHIVSVSPKPEYKKKRSVQKVSKAIDKKQVVRVGSNFSFDIEFYKKSSNKPVKIQYHDDEPPKRTKEKQSSVQTKDKKIITSSDTQDSESQSKLHKVKAKTSQALQGVQRCFCTLKLQKQGKLKQKGKKDNTNTVRDESMSVKTVNRGQNTKPIKMTRELLPYECEPGICIPGECNPYECLELIKKRKRKEKGTDTVLHKKVTTTSTSSTVQKRKSRATYVQPKRQPKFHSETVKPKYKQVTSPDNAGRQTVRIGSSFSFNIDFYKDSSPPASQERVIKTDKYKHSDEVPKIPVAKEKINKQNFTHPRSQSKISQTLKVPQKSSSIDAKPFLQRCFCTLQLRKKEKQKEEKRKRDDVKKVQQKNVKTMTKGTKEVRELLPYECEPSFCIPGECDPYVCYERIKQRNKKIKSLGTETKTRSKKTTGSTPTSKKQKHKKIQFQHVDDEPKTAAKSSVPKPIVQSGQKQVVRIGSNFSFNVEFFKDSGLDSNRIQYDESQIRKNKTKDVKKDTETFPKTATKKHKIVQDKKSLRSGQSQTETSSKSVKSGIISNLERCFCTLALMKDKKAKKKDNSKEDKAQLKKNKKEVKVKQDGKGEKVKKNKKDKKDEKDDKIKKDKKDDKNKKDKKNKKGKNAKPVDKDVQTTKSSASAVSSFIKNCLCSLKENKKKQSPIVNVEIKPQKHKKWKLEPYECEPGVCTPGQCDPYECEKRIQKRLLRENATETRPIKFNTHSSSTPAKTYKNRNVKTKPLKPEPKEKKELPLVMPKSKPNQSLSLDRERNNKQTVRIGSSFSFNIEFFKDNLTPEPIRKIPPHLKDVDTISTKKEKPKYKSTGQQSSHHVKKFDSSELSTVKTQPSSTVTDPILKRCFCTLQFHKSAARLNKNHNIQKKPARNKKKEEMPKQKKTTSTKNTTTVSYVTCPNECPPFMCIPNKCKSKVCREKHIKTGSQKVGNEDKILHKSVDAKLLCKKSKKVQAQLKENVSLKCYNEKEKGIVEIPRFSNYFKKENRQALKFGSNISLNIEFYKELLPPVPVDTSDTKKEYLKPKKYETCDRSNCLNLKKKNVQALRSNVRGVKSQIEKCQTINKRSNTVNKLKRCFCTLKLQKSKNDTIACRAPYSQVIEVRRVEIHSNNKKTSKKTNTECKNVCTKIDATLLNSYKRDKSSPQKNITKMTTILPYQPTKFKKNVSKSLVNHGKPHIQKPPVKPSITLTQKGKRLTRKKSVNAFHCSQLPSSNKTNNSAIKRYLCRCANNATTKTGKSTFSEPVCDKIAKNKEKPCKQPNENEKTSKKIKGDVNGLCVDDLKTSHSERQSKHLKEVSAIRTSKSLKLSQKDKDISNLEKLKILKADLIQKGDEYKAPLSKLIKSAMKSPDDKNFVCSKCLAIHNTTERKNLKVNFKDSPHTLGKQGKSNKKASTTKDVRKTKSKNVCESCNKSIDEKCKYCKVCFKSESQFKEYFNMIMKQIGKLPIKTWLNKIQPKEFIKESHPQPLFDVYLESDSLKIINKEEVDRKVKELYIPKRKTKPQEHGDSCVCCICRGKRAKVGKSNKVTKKQLLKFGKKTCTCGSEVCAKSVEEKRLSILEDKKSKELKPCICGSPVCGEESQLMHKITKSPGEMVCTCREEMEKRRQKMKKINEIAYRKRRKILSEQEKREDIIRRKHRLKEDLRLEKSIKKDASDTMLLTESVIDVAKLGITGVSDLLRLLYRCVRDPKHSLYNIKSMKENPSLILKSLKNAYSDSGVASTSRRVMKRVQSMEAVKSATELLEQYPATNYLIHINNPKKRMQAIKKKRRKERIDFHCNLFMSSLRKRPFMWIYDRWPWFYPHCLSILNVWRQFADVMLFLLAVVVWSPCIFAMEMCRAVMCCTLCTG